MCDDHSPQLPPPEIRQHDGEAGPGGRPPAAASPKRFLRFSLRSLLLAVTFWSVLVFACTRLGLVEAVDVLLAFLALLILCSWFVREFGVARRKLAALLVVLHVVATPPALVVAYFMTLGSERWTWQGVTAWSVAGALMFPVALLHHFVCRYCGWETGLAQPGTFSLIVVLNSLLWAYLWRWRQAQRHR
jgi:hypothetical protein